MDLIKTICAVIVTYNSGKIYEKNFLAIISQINKIIIIDNNSDFETINLLKSLEQKYDKLEVIYNDENIGLARAQNIGIEIAIKLQYKWVLLLDDDSEAEPKMIESMKNFYSTYPNKQEIAILAPYIKDEKDLDETIYYIEKRSFFKLRENFSENKILDLYFAISSGSLVKTQIFEKIGKFRDDFFIDYIDIEFGLRICAARYKIIAIRDAILKHRLGDKKIHNILGFKILTLNHNHIRKYHIFKNRIKVWRLYILKFPSFIIFDILSSIYFLAKTIILEKDRVLKVKMITKAIIDGFIEDIK